MAINSRTKGQVGEREICQLLNEIDARVLHSFALPLPPVVNFQRNQNQSAVGGSDITNPYRLAIEVKRVEANGIETWWKQCEAQASRDQSWPILLHRKNRQPWRVRTLVSLGAQRIPADFAYDYLPVFIAERIAAHLVALRRHT